MKLSEIALCQRCRTAALIKAQLKLCDPCELDFLRVWQHNAIKASGVTHAA